MPFWMPRRSWHSLRIAAHVFVRGQDRGGDDRLLDRLDLARVGQARGRVDLDHLAVGLDAPGSAPTGAVVIRSRSNSRSSRSWTISMWSRPRKPQRKPKPSAAEVSGSKVNEASLSRSFSIASRRSS